MGDDLERAIEVICEPGGGAADGALRARALEYCEGLRRGPPAALLRLCLDRLAAPSTPVPVSFWCLQSLHDSLPHLPPSTFLLLRSSLLSLASSPSSPLLSSPPYLKNKLAQALAALVRLHYPDQWPDPFLHLLAAGPPALDMLLRLLASLDDDLLGQDYPRSPEDAAAAMRVKDGIRVQCAAQLARVWFDAAAGGRGGGDPGLAAQALDVARRHVPWIDIGLVANDAFVPVLFDLVEAPTTPDSLCAAAAGVLLAVVAKRMEPRAKVALLRSLRVSRVFTQVELIPKLADLITGYAAEALESHKRLGMEDAEKAAAMELLEEVLPSLFYLMQNCEQVDFGNAIDFLLSYVSTMKSPSQKQLVYVRQILEVIRLQIQYDSIYRINLDAPDKVGKEEEDEMAEHRKGFFTLFRSVCRVAPDVTQLFIRNLLAAALSSSAMSVEEVEAALSLFYQLGEAVSQEAMKTGSGSLGEMVSMLLSARFLCHSHRIVALVYLETITRYMKFVQENDQYIPHVLTAFLDERGIHHPNFNVSRRASYLFMRAVKLLKAKLVPFIETILQSLQDTVAQFTTLDWRSKERKCTGSEDGSHTFEAIGLLIGVEDVSPEKQAEYLAALLTPLCQQVESLIMDAKAQKIEESSAKVASVQQTIMAINALSKGFSERLVTTSRPTIGIMFKQTLDVLLQILVMFPNIEPLRNKTISFLHRMVDILGASVFPYLPMALKQLLAESEPKEMVEFLLLLNQLICKFSSSVVSILEDIFPAIASRLFHILPGDAFPCGPGCNTEEARELQELQRTLYTFLHVMTTHDLSSVFLAPNSIGYLYSIMQLLLFASCKHKDIIVRKQCVQIFVRLIKDWCTKYNGEDKVPGFRSFIIESFATNCCLCSVLEESFEFRDANTLVLFGEIVTAQKVMYEKFGDDFIVHFVSRGLPAAHCPRELAEEYYQKLQGNDIKAFRSFYQSLIENLRQQQNGSLVFR